MIFNNIYPPDVPDSTLDPDLATERLYQCKDFLLNIACGDWVDVDGAIPLDVYWGSSFQVCNTYDDNTIGILVSIDDGESYQETCLSTQYILNNYRRMPNQ